MAIQIVQDAAVTGRKPRRPQHTFNLKHRPYEIAPFMIAPVLPGETLKNFLLQSRCVTDPLTNRLTGWWLEYYLFYVPHQAMTGDRTALETMMLDPSATQSALKTTTDNMFLYFEGGASGHINWQKKCLDAVVNEFFREDGTDVTTAAGLFGSNPIAQVHGESWLDSVLLRSQLPDGGEIPEDASNVSYDQFDRLQALYELQREMGLANMTYDDWLATYGVTTPKQEDPTRPELLRYSKDWSYPTNTVDPLTGVPTSAQSWVTAIRGDKDRFFKWPGFIFGVTVARPKVYFSKQKGAAVALMDDAFSWFPALMNEEGAVGLKTVGATDGPLAGNTGGNQYVVDIRDLLIYGDQFVNYDMTSVVDRSLVALPTTAMQKRFAASADVDALFSGSTAATRLVHQDGIAAMTILGRQHDMTPGSHAKQGVG